MESEEEDSVTKKPCDEDSHSEPNEKTEEVVQEEKSKEESQDKELKEIAIIPNESEESIEELEETDTSPKEIAPDDEVIALLTAMGMAKEEAIRVISGPKEEGEESIQKIVLPSIELSDEIFEQFAVTPEEPVLGFKTIFQRIGDLKVGIDSLESEVASTLVSWVQQLREDLVEVRTSIGQHFAEKLKMKMFKKFVEKTYEDILLKEFEKIESNSLKELTQHLSENFFKTRANVAKAETSLSRSVEEQENVVRSYLSTLEREIEDLREIRTELKADLEVKDAQIERLQAQTRGTGSVGELERELKVRKDEITLLKKQVEEREKERIELASKLTDLSALRTGLQRRDKQLETHKSTITNLRNRLSELEGKLEAQRHDLETLSEKEQIIATLEEKLTDRRAKILELTEQLDAMQAALATGDKRAQKIHEQTETIDELRKQISKLTAELSTAHSEIELLQGIQQKADEQERTIGALIEQLNVVQKKLRIAETKVESLRETEETIAVERKTIEELRDTNATLEAKLGTATAEIESMKRRLNRLKDTETIISKLRGRIAELTKKVKDYEGELSLAAEQQEEFEKRQQEIDQLQMTIGNLESELGTSTARLETANSEIEKLQQQLTKTEADRKEMAKLRQRIADLQEEIALKEEEFAKARDWTTSPEYAQLMTKIDQFAEQLKIQRRLLQQLREGIKGDPKYDMLFMLQDIKGTMSIKEIATAIGVPSPLAQRYAMEFEKMELVTLKGEGTDAQVQSILTALESKLEETAGDAPKKDDNDTTEYTEMRSP
ncbi:MAG: hypothetical protein ACE5R6_09420 [Candidatus Heimdallarchaeota archaeon]